MFLDKPKLTVFQEDGLLEGSARAAWTPTVGVRQDPSRRVVER